MSTPTIYSNIQTVAAFLDANIGPEFRENVIMPGLTYAVDLDQIGSDSKKLREAGGFTASQPTEANDSVLSNYAETSPATLVATHTKVYGEISYKAEKFTQVNPLEMLDKAAEAIATFVDETALALTPSFTQNVVGSAAAANSAEILSEAIFKLDAQKVKGQRAYILNPQQIQDVREDLLTNSPGAAAVFHSPQMLTIMSGLAPQQNGFKGVYFDVPVFSTTSTADATVGYDEAWLGLCVSIQDAIALGFAGSVSFKTGDNLKKSVYEFAADLFFDAKIYRNKAGVKIISQKG